MPANKKACFDHLVIGSGLAGLSSALRLSEFGSVVVITKKKATECNTIHAQGGVACVTDASDSFKDHVKDTLSAGDHLCDLKAVRAIIESGPECVRDLISLGAHFTTMAEMGEPGHNGDYHLGREGGHGRRRVLHAGDITGEEIHRTLLKACKDNPRITLLERHAAVDLITSWRLGWMGDNRCLGAYVLDAKTGKIKTFLAKTTVLACGGAGKAYLYTSNADTACGDGVAMAYRAHAKIANMEFFQFHPTILYHPKVRSFLVSEAVRGEGAVLKVRNSKGDYVEFMDRYHEMGSLAPRDIVARAIDNELKRRGQECAFLDIRCKDKAFLVRRFPTIYAKCLEAGVNMAKDLIPVVPAAHYCCGGVRTDTCGFTGITGLYAVGEVACTGLHGANRLASNSLLEALVVPKIMADDIKERLPELDRTRPSGNVSDWTAGEATDSDEMVVITHNWDEIRRFMWDYVGIVRTTKRLERAKARIRNIRQEIEKYYWDFYVTLDLIELRNISTVAELIIDSALQRKESRGLHYNADFPDREPRFDNIDTILQKPHQR